MEEPDRIAEAARTRRGVLPGKPEHLLHVQTAPIAAEIGVGEPELPGLSARALLERHIAVGLRAPAHLRDVETRAAVAVADHDPADALHQRPESAGQIGRASCRESV